MALEEELDAISRLLAVNVRMEHIRCLDNDGGVEEMRMYASDEALLRREEEEAAEETDSLIELEKRLTDGGAKNFDRAEEAEDRQPLLRPQNAHQWVSDLMTEYEMREKKMLEEQEMRRRRKLKAEVEELVRRRKERQRKKSKRPTRIVLLDELPPSVRDRAKSRAKNNDKENKNKRSKKSAKKDDEIVFKIPAIPNRRKETKIVVQVQQQQEPIQRQQQQQPIQRQQHQQPVNKQQQQSIQKQQQPCKKQQQPVHKMQQEQESILKQQKQAAPESIRVPKGASLLRSNHFQKVPVGKSLLKCNNRGPQR